MRKIFNNVLLLQYLEVGATLKVFANGGYYEIVSVSDIMNNAEFTAVDIYGKPQTFKYTDIEHLLVNGEVVDMEDLEQGYKDPEEPDAEESDDEDTEDEEESDGEDEDDEFSDDEVPDFQEPGGEGDGEDEEGDLADWFNPGDYVQNVDPMSSDFQKRGAVILVESDGYVSYEHYSVEQGRMITKLSHHSNLRRV